MQDKGHQVTRISPTNEKPANILLRRLWFNRKLPRILQQQAFDLAVGFDIDGFLYSTVKSRIPYVVCIKGVLAEEARQEKGRVRLLLQGLSCLERRNARNADLVFTTSEYCRRAVIRHYGVPRKRIPIVPEGINLSCWQLPRSQTSRKNGRTILCVAKQYPRKRIVDLLQAMPLVRKEIAAVQALIIGDGPELDRLHSW